MRKLQKMQIFELVETLGEACKELEKYKEETFISLCADIQEFVSVIYVKVIEVVGAESKIAQLLEVFYEMMFRVSKKEVTIKKLHKLINKMIMAVTGLEVDKIEIAFFCYKASMSDSFESIYFAAKKDPECDVYFIPIPYFDKKPDGSLGQMHIEAFGYYSDKYELTDWRDYNVEVRHPDVAFIMNPFDDGNFVTSVHPKYYSKKLKSMCELLCYVPYYVSNNNVDYVSNEKESMCATAGIRYSDYIFLQSDTVKCAFINALKKIESQNSQGSFGDLENKIISLGSPKFDKVINTKREDCTLPKDWANLIGNKKVILYNTTISTILHYNEQCLEKIRSVLLTFKKRDDVVLWWRPHPLSKQTIASMRPWLVDDYNQIVKEYCSAGFGIYDESPDLQRAIAWSDKYYGDRSSIIWLYGITGKPVLISSTNQYKRTNFEIESWFTADIETEDLSIWLDGKENWKLKKTFSDIFSYGFSHGDSGKCIYEYCKKMVKNI